MHIIVTDSADEVARIGALAFIDLLENKPDAVLGLATGSTPVLLYRQLVDAHRNGRVSFARARSFNLDEYLDLEPAHPQSYRTFMERHFFSKIDIQPQHTMIPSATRENAHTVCAAYEAQIRLAGGIDLQLLGIGRNGHIGFNEPDSPFNSRTRLTQLSPSTLQANARFFEHIDEQPTCAVTMGIATILDAKRILLLATGASKAAAVRAAIEGQVSPHCPASSLRQHADVTLVLDSGAASGLADPGRYRQSQPRLARRGPVYTN